MKGFTADLAGWKRRKALDQLSAATGNLPPALVAKALDQFRTMCEYDLKHSDEFTDDEVRALRLATFEVRQ